MDVQLLKQAHSLKRDRISQRLSEFQEVGRTASNERLFEEMCFCILTANASAKMGIKSILSVKAKLKAGSQKQLAKGLTGVYRFPNKRSEYIVLTRKHLEKNYGFELRRLLGSFEDFVELRDFLVENVKGFGYKEASHYMRNIGFKGVCILDKHILNSLAELGVVESPDPPKNKQEYLETEAKMKEFAEQIDIDIDEMDLLLWSLKTGEILK